nr:MAG TPA: hypothetical protein [Caudoviricetes sp.]
MNYQHILLFFREDYMFIYETILRRIYYGSHNDFGVYRSIRHNVSVCEVHRQIQLIFKSRSLFVDSYFCFAK